MTVGTSTKPTATSTFAVTTNQDRAEAYYNSSGGQTGAIQDTVDAVSSVLTGGSVLSFRNESTAGAVHVPPYAYNAKEFLQGFAFTAGDGGTFNYGSLPFQGSAANLPLVKPVVGAAADVAGPGDYLVASDGGVFAYNEATFLGFTGHLALAKPVVGMVATNGTVGTGGYLLRRRRRRGVRLQHAVLRQPGRHHHPRTGRRDLR